VYAKVYATSKKKIAENKGFLKKWGLLLPGAPDRAFQKLRQR